MPTLESLDRPTVPETPETLKDQPIQQKTISELEREWYPPENRFVVEFTSHHLCIDGRWYQNTRQRRFRLALCAADALQNVQKEFENWDPQFHKISDIRCRNCPDATPYVGYQRFGTEHDIRFNTHPTTQETP